MGESEYVLSEDEIRKLAGAGAAAPSGGNMQPWRLNARADSLELLLDPERSDNFMDVDGAASLLALGSFTENASVTAHALGLEHRVELGGSAEPVAPQVRFVFTGRHTPPEPPPPLHEAIHTRATNRRPWDGRAIDPEKVSAVRQAARSLGEAYDLRAEGDEEGKGAIAAALAEADVVRTFNRRYHEHMLSEMRWTSEEAEATADGLDIATLELPKGAITGLRMMRSRLFVALMVSRSRIRSMSDEALRRSSHLCCVTMPREVRAPHLLTAGRALQRAWLTATTLGLWIQPWCVAPFFVLRAESHPETLNAGELSTIMDIDRRLATAWDVPRDQRVIFTFRLFTADPPSSRALRRPWERFTRLEEDRGSDPSERAAP